MHGSHTSDNHSGWSSDAYNPGAAPGSNLGDDGDRVTLTQAVVRVDIEAEEIVPGSGNSFLAGTPATFKIDGTVTAPVVALASPAQDVYVTNMLPSGIFINDPSTVYPLVTDEQAVEFWDGSAWSATFPQTGKAFGVRWFYGEEPINSSLPEMGYQAIIPFDAPDGTAFTNEVQISSTSDSTHDQYKTASTGVVAVQQASINASEFTATPLVATDSDVVFTFQIANLSKSDSTFLEAATLIPFDGDLVGSSFSGTIDNISINNLPTGMVVYVSSTAAATLDGLDGSVDGTLDPLATTNPNYQPPGTGDWVYTLDDVINGVAGAPAMNAITGLRIASDGTVIPILPAESNMEWDLVLTPSGNAGLPTSDVYRNKFVTRVNTSILPLPVVAPLVEAKVTEPELSISTEIMLDPLGFNIDPTNDAHWGEVSTILSGEDVYYRVKVTNTGTSLLTAVNVTGLIPAGMTYVAGSAIGEGDKSGIPADWVVGIAPGDTATLIFAASGTFVSEGNVVNTVDANTADAFGQTASVSDPAIYTVNLNPDATDDSYVTDDNTSIVGQVLDGTGGGTDSDPGNDALTVYLINDQAADVGTQIQLPSGAQITLNSDGTFDYDPSGGFDYLTVGQSETDSFTYTISDGDGGFDTATVNITVNGAYDLPEIDHGFASYTPSWSGNPVLTETNPREIILSDGFFAVDSDESYTLSATAWSGDGAGGNYNPGTLHYLGHASYDIDYNFIDLRSFYAYSGSQTTLAADLNRVIPKSCLTIRPVGTTVQAKTNPLRGMDTLTVPDTFTKITNTQVTNGNMIFGMKMP